MKTKLIYPLAVIGLLGAANAVADGFGFGVKGGTLGLGTEGNFGISEQFNARVGLNSYNFRFDETASGIDYNAEIDMNSTALILDWHPFSGTFRLSAGLINNKNAGRLSATPTSNQQIGNTTYTPAQIGTLSGEVTFRKNVPYLGLGWGNAVGRGSRFGLNFEVGVMKQGKADVRLRSSNSMVSQSDLDREAQAAEDDMSSFDTYPVISLGFSWRF